MRQFGNQFGPPFSRRKPGAPMRHFKALGLTLIIFMAGNVGVGLKGNSTWWPGLARRPLTWGEGCSGVCPLSGVRFPPHKDHSDGWAVCSRPALSRDGAGCAFLPAVARSKGDLAYVAAFADAHGCGHGNLHASRCRAGEGFSADAWNIATAIFYIAVPAGNQGRHTTHGGSVLRADIRSSRDGSYRHAHHARACRSFMEGFS